MFLEVTRQRNPRLIQAALEFHQAGKIPPNTYLLDYDTIEKNARLLSEAALVANMSLYFITKQIGHHPWALEAIQRGGLRKGTAVDTIEAYALAGHKVQLGNVGHLTQIPTHDIEPIVRLAPEVLTVFSYAKAEQIARVAHKLGHDVDVLLRVQRPGDYFFPGQIGGIPLESVAQTVRAIHALPCIKVVGVTSYPCLMYDEDHNELRPLPNLETVLRARDVLEHELGYRMQCVNTPGATSVSALKLLAKHGVTHAEPGHALTGTTPLHARGDQPETPAMVYVSEVSHIEGRTAYIFGGGFYRRSKIKGALVGSTLKHLDEPSVACNHPPADMIDYYGQLDNVPERVRVGDTVIAAFRTQIFVTRSYAAVVKGLHTGQPVLSGLWDARGRPVVNGPQPMEGV